MSGEAEARPARGLIPRLRGRFAANYQHSVFRRTALLLGLIVPAFGANFALLYVAAMLLGPADFGIFYVANTLGNILFSASLILNLFFTRYLVGIVRQHGAPAGCTALMAVERAVILYGGAVAALVFAAMLALAAPLGVRSWLIALLIVFDAYTSYVADLGRALLQSLRRTVWLGSYTLVWMLLRFALATAGILVFGRVTAALMGVILATVLTYGGFRLVVARASRRAGLALPPVPTMATLLPAILGFGLLILASNLDVLVSYLRLPGDELGSYSASSIFPKAMLVITLPLLQMLFPAMIGSDVPRAELRTLLRKSIAVMLLLSLGGGAILWLAAPWSCGGAWGIRLCDARLLHILLFSVVPLVMLRVVVLWQFARGAEWSALALLLPIAGYAALALGTAADSAAIADQFAIFAAVALLFGLVAPSLGDRLRRPLF